MQKKKGKAGKDRKLAACCRLRSGEGNACQVKGWEHKLVEEWGRRGGSAYGGLRVGVQAARGVALLRLSVRYHKPSGRQGVD